MLIEKIEQKFNWQKYFGIIPVIVQNENSGIILMLGFMNKESYELTKISNKITFFSRKKKYIWVKGEKSNNFLPVINIFHDCDYDSLLIFSNPQGLTCHTGTKSCFNYNANFSFIFYLEKIINNYKKKNYNDSYTIYLYNKGINYISQKVGEEAVEVAISAIIGSKNEIINESADLLYHLLVLLQIKNLNFNNIIYKLQERNIK